MNKNNIVIVTGMTGVGKDFLVDRSIEGLEITKIGWGDLLSHELKANKDAMMDMISPEVILNGQFEVCRKVLAQQPVVALCHVIKPEGDKLVYNLEIERMLNPTAYVFVTAPPEIIFQRVRARNAKGERVSQEIPTNEIKRVQDIKIDAIRKLADIQGSKLLILQNEEGRLDQNISALRELFKEIDKT